MAKINAFLQKLCFSSQQGFWSEWNIQNQQTGKELGSPYNYINSPSYTKWDAAFRVLQKPKGNWHAFWKGKEKGKKKKGQHSQDLILPSTGVWSKCGIQQCWEFIFIWFTYMWCCLRRISQLIGNIFLKFQWRKWFSNSLTKYSLNICYVSNIMLFWGIQRLIKHGFLSFELTRKDV